MKYEYQATPLETAEPLTANPLAYFWFRITLALLVSIVLIAFLTAASSERQPAQPQTQDATPEPIPVELPYPKPAGIELASPTKPAVDSA